VESLLKKSETATANDTQALIGLHPLGQIFRAVVITGRVLRHERLFPGINLPQRSFERFRCRVIEAIDKAKVIFQDGQDVHEPTLRYLVQHSVLVCCTIARCRSEARRLFHFDSIH
jgi:hypothetical protein